MSAPNANPRPAAVGELFKPIESKDEFTVEQIAEILVRLSKYELRKVRAFLYAMENCGGCITPAEELIMSLVGDYGALGGCLTSNDVKGHVEEFDSNWKDLTDSLDGAAKRYPHLFAVVRTKETHARSETENVQSVAETKTSESSQESESDLEAKSHTARFARSLVDACVQNLQFELEFALSNWDCRPDVLAALTADLSALRAILDNWASSDSVNRHPGELKMITAIQGFLEV
jgi:hypothetical protein